MQSLIFVYTGREQEVPRNVTHVIIDRSVKIIPRAAFYQRQFLVSVETHDGIEKVEGKAFYGCTALREIRLPGVRIVEEDAFHYCINLTDVAFGDKLETIEYGAFAYCKYLQRIAIPLKDNMFPLHPITQQYNQFNQQCLNLTTVDLVGVERIHNTIASLLLESWKDEMNQEINRINQDLPNIPSHEKTNAIRLWIRSVLNRMEHYKAEHYALLKENMTQLELALWKAKLDANAKLNEREERDVDGKSAKKAKIDVDTIRREQRITSGADIIIANVLPFLQLAK
jgi:hypothetical protein